jgi:transcription-repair coupling factor
MSIELISNRIKSGINLYLDKNIKKPFHILSQTSFELAPIIAEVIGKSLKARVEILYFKKGEEFRQWLSENKKHQVSSTKHQVDNLSVINHIEFKVGSKYSFADTADLLTQLGYSRQIRAQYPGEFSLLGDMLYIFPEGFENIIRLEFYSDELENISLIDTETRKPVRSERNIIVTKRIINGEDTNSKSNLKVVVGNSLANSVCNTRFVMVGDGLPGYDLKKFNIGLQGIPGGQYIVGEFKAIARLIKQYWEKGWKVSIVTSDPEFQVKIWEKLCDLLENDAKVKEVSVILVNDNEKKLYKKGFEISELKEVYFTDYELNAELEIVPTTGNRLFSHGSIRKGDYVVHADHGVALFEGIVVQNEESYLLLKYAGEDKLYVPFSQIESLTKYIGARNSVPKLTKLNGGQWNRMKASVRKDLQQVAKELLQLFYLRKNTKTSSIVTMEDGLSEFKKFVESFEYKETEDQMATSQEIIKDFRREFPMDRLVVGDVGFGKTEVAMRAAFLATNVGKQVAVLAPTTLLVEQHKAVFRKRFENFANIRIASLSRFQTAAERNGILRELEAGKIDILIGTHSILSSSVKFKELGLIIIDEEQRFGVKHKEKLKVRRLDSHVLTLTATPIPRTLGLSLSGIRDISVIETPPENRKPVENYTGKFDWDVVKFAIEKEISHGGQVYYLHNRVKDIEGVALKLSELLPDLRVDIVHGQMAVHHLAKVMREFAEGNIDVLVCTTIVENGIDLPNVNTLIIDDIEKLGLAQMYQIRGRIGRSEKQGYAYLLYSNLRGNSSLRLEAMKEFQELGVGYRLANRDLEIRGSGSILGDSQSGFIDSVGYSLYMQIFNEEVLNGRRNEKTVNAEKDSVKHEFDFVEQIWLR